MRSDATLKEVTLDWCDPLTGAVFVVTAKVYHRSAPHSSYAFSQADVKALERWMKDTPMRDAVEVPNG